MAGDFGLQSASGHLTVPEESKERYPADVEARFRADASVVISRYPQKRSALLPLLHLVQSVDGYVTGRGIDLCAELLDLTRAEVSGVSTFYTQYKRHPNGEYTVGVCTNTLCAIMGGDEIFEAVSEHLGVGHDETTEDGKITLERVECNAACDYAPVVMANWEFFDNQTPESTKELVDDLRAGKDVRPTRGPNRVCTFTQVSRTLAGFDDGLADEGPAAGPASLVGLEIAKRNGWVAPEGEAARSGSSDGAATDTSEGRTTQDKAQGTTETTPASDEAEAENAEPAADEAENAQDTPGEEKAGDATTEKPEVVSTGDGVRGVHTTPAVPAETVDISPAQQADPKRTQDKAANVSAQSASTRAGQDAAPEATLFDGGDAVAPDRGDHEDAGFGEGSARSGPDGLGPRGWDVKGNADSMLFHTPQSPWYGRTKAEVWFRDAASAQAAGFTDARERRRDGKGK